jgi:hypothetical protein
MNIASCQYQANKETNDNISVIATINGQTMSVPLDPANRHYAEILKQVEAGTLTIAAAD